MIIPIVANYIPIRISSIIPFLGDDFPMWLKSFVLNHLKSNIQIHENPLVPNGFSQIHQSTPIHWFFINPHQKIHENP